MRSRIESVLTLPNGKPGGRRQPASLLGGAAARGDSLSLGDMLAFSIPEFCRRHGISRAHFYNLSKTGDAPTVMRVGRRTLISAEAAAAWRRDATDEVLLSKRYDWCAAGRVRFMHTRVFEIPLPNRFVPRESI